MQCQWPSTCYVNFPSLQPNYTQSVYSRLQHNNLLNSHSIFLFFLRMKVELLRQFLTSIDEKKLYLRKTGISQIEVFDLTRYL